MDCIGIGNSLKMENLVTKHIDDLKNKSATEVIQEVVRLFETELVFSTSFGLEDQVITDMIYTNNLPVEIFTLDTGRLFAETYQLHDRVLDKYKKKITPYFPDTSSLEKLVREKGPESFYSSVENRIECCNIRKVEPLKRALKGKKIWFTGIRKAQSSDRANTPVMEYDPGHDIIKVHPLLDWSDEQLWDYVEKNSVPVNPLHKKGFVSIGCAPCTRAVQPGDDPRAGRWWWEDQNNKECGLHIK